MARENKSENPQNYFFFGRGTCRPYKPSAVLSRKGTGRREMTERRDTEKPRYRDAEFHRERPELMAKIQYFIIFVILQASSLLRRDPVSSSFLFIGGLFWSPTRFFDKTLDFHWVLLEPMESTGFFGGFSGTRFSTEK